jgi:hypothetical protein
MIHPPQAVARAIGAWRAAAEAKQPLNYPRWQAHLQILSMRDIHASKFQIIMLKIKPLVFMRFVM